MAQKLSHIQDSPSQSSRGVRESIERAAIAIWTKRQQERPLKVALLFCITTYISRIPEPQIAFQGQSEHPRSRFDPCDYIMSDLERVPAVT